MLDTPRSKVVWRVLATHYIRQFPLHFPSRASPCAITFQLESATQYLATRENHIHKAQRGQLMPPADIRTKNLQNTRSECHRCTNLFDTSKRGQLWSCSKLGSVPSTVCCSHTVQTYYNQPRYLAGRTQACADLFQVCIAFLVVSPSASIGQSTVVSIILRLSARWVSRTRLSKTVHVHTYIHTHTHTHTHTYISYM